VTSWSFCRFGHFSILLNICLFRKILLIKVYNIVIKPYWGQFNRISYQFECKYSTFYVNVMRFSNVTGYVLQVKSENLYISDVRKILGSEFRVRDSARNVDPRVEFPYPTSIQMKDSLSIMQHVVVEQPFKCVVENT
jgi:hypothetical protein